ncbi:DUF4238 domain-containing protein [Rhodococcoides fascians]|uniref:DUF4238 domain-containing protein n=1 Tax=Rhodococcoides fascians TaxID=1828 RepID=UPI00050CCBAB|nr:DUF4238 domain-containing protein [Rhodococcus fascians]
MAKLKKHQHVVPRTYLRGWADSEGHISVLDRGSAAPQRRPVSNTAVRTQFYNMIGSDGAKTDAIENWLGNRIEAPVGPTLKALRSGGNIGDVDTVTIINFTVAQLIRTPTVFAIMAGIDETTGPLLLLAEAAKTAGFDLLTLSEADRDRCVEVARRAWAANRSASDTKASSLRTMVRKLDEIATQVASWHWNVLTSSEPVLITGDSPVATINPTGHRWSGLIPPGSPLWMPLSPTKLLVGEPTKPLRTQVDLPTELSTVVTAQLARQADRSLFNTPGVNWPAGLAFVAQKPTLAEPTITWGKQSGPLSFPAAYPPISSAEIGALLSEIGAVDRVE